MVVHKKSESIATSRTSVADSFNNCDAKFTKLWVQQASATI